MGSPIRLVVSAALLVSLTAPAAYAKEPRGDSVRQDPGGGPFRSRLESERENKLRRAREEIRRDPSQKKFILFRHGLKEDELR